MKEVFREDGVSEVVEEMLILALAVIVFIVISNIVIHDYTSQNSPSSFAGFAVNSETVHIGAGKNGLALGQAALVLNLTYVGKALPVENTTMTIFMGGQVFYVRLTDNDFSSNSQWYPAGPLMSGEYVLFNSSLSNTIPANVRFNTTGLGFAFVSSGNLIWSNEVFYSIPVITGLTYSPSHILTNESLNFDLYIYSSYEVLSKDVKYEIVDAHNQTVISSGKVYPVNLTSSNEWYFPAANSHPVSLPYLGSYYLTVTVYYHPPDAPEESVSVSFTLVAF